MAVKRKNGQPVVLELNDEQKRSVIHSLKNSMVLYRRYAKLRPETRQMHNRQEAARRHMFNLCPVLKRLRTAK
jgi:hypothetical protein